MENINKPMPVRVSISEAARLFGISTKTVREAIKNSEIFYIISRGRYRINFESLLKWSQESTRRRNRLSASGIGQFVEKWSIHNKKYSPSEELVKRVQKKKA
ncbi:MAG: hypothetical protein A3J62_00070 [Candidatus Buchananbacteria bacterium RIFCSPHIGHO2_02_FULL_38_8]|uniref:Helix-turn-helix domain-containing protein n=1 Tax=Candidatus Buchananbacteria bacterium RIFCSPHIGHO2_02_FULL_38_8 TaxID=1797538 RepID=A0A1G1Y4P6_9BACT|nr:MAG: hypothetical protein A3J62_00070 [Candidatus Buchananbacteria bacterium RIFCSPHIGHO2_02_FULL_38_8]